MYQTFGDGQGDSDSQGKLSSLKLPILQDKAVLDLGCNEGFFCNVAHEMGASKVVGTDIQAEMVYKAGDRFPDIDFQLQDWKDLADMDGVFDVVLCLSAFHYAKDKEQLLSDIANKLSDDGLFVLEAGIVEGDQEEWVDVERFSDTVQHPTKTALDNLLRKFFSIRCAGPSVNQKGDPVPRFVYHCTKLKPVALIISGKSKDGKTTLAHMIGARTVCWDHIFTKNKLGDTDKIDQITDQLIKDGKADDLVSMVMEEVDQISGLVVLEGYGFGLLPIQKELEDRGFIVWSTIRS